MDEKVLEILNNQDLDLDLFVDLTDDEKTLCYHCRVYSRRTETTIKSYKEKILGDILNLLVKDFE